MLKSVDADLALLNSGTLRSDVIHKAGPFKMKDLMSILPMVDPLVVIQVTGWCLVTILCCLKLKKCLHPANLS